MNRLDLKWNDLRSTSRHSVFRHSRGYKVCISNYIHAVRHWDGLSGIPRFMTTGRRVQALFGYCLSNMRGCNVGITDGSDLWSATLKWDHLAMYIHDDWYSRWSNIKVLPRQYEVLMLVLLMGGIYEARSWNGLRWHEMRTKFHDNCFRYLINITPYS
jgi:hypothetical protein